MIWSNLANLVSSHFELCKWTVKQQMLSIEKSCHSTQVVYICASLLHLAVESEKKVTVVKPEQIHKMTIFLNQNGPGFSFWVKIVVILWFCSALQAVLSFSAWEKSCDSTPNSQKLEHM